MDDAKKMELVAKVADYSDKNDVNEGVAFLIVAFNLTKEQAEVVLDGENVEGGTQGLFLNLAEETHDKLMDHIMALGEELSMISYVVELNYRTEYWLNVAALEIKTAFDKAGVPVNVETLEKAIQADADAYATRWYARYPQTLKE